MKHHKNIVLSLSSYAIALIWFFSVVFIADFFIKPGTAVSSTIGSVTNITFLGIFFIIIFGGIFFALKSNKQKESSWVGNFLAAFGIVGFLFYLLLMAGLMI
jgi:hypothetical protein